MAVSAKPLRSPVPLSPLERMSERVVSTSTAPIAITSNATATVSKDRHCDVERFCTQEIVVTLADTSGTQIVRLEGPFASIGGFWCFL